MPLPSLRRRSFASALLAAAAGTASPLVRSQPKPEKSRLAIAVGGKASFFYLPLTVAEQLGYFKAEGLDVEIADFPSGAAALQAVRGGGADVVSGSYENTISLQGKGQFFQSIVLQGRAPQIALGVSTRSMPGYRAVADLRGKKIGVTEPSSTTGMIASMVLARGGVLAHEVSYVGVGTSASALAALRSGQIEAMSNIDPVMTMLEQKGDVKIISDTRTLKGTLEIFGGPMPAACLQAPQDFVERNHNTCQALAHAVVHALKWLQTAGPSDIIKTVPEAYLLGDRALYLASFAKVREAIAIDGLLPEEGARTALKALAGFEPGLKPARIDLDRTYTNSFARKAKERFNA